MRYATFVKQATLIKTRLTSLDDQVLALNDSPAILSDAQIAKLKKIDETAASKNCEFEALLQKLFDTDPPPDGMNDDEIATLQGDISDLHIKIHSNCASLLPAKEHPSADTIYHSRPIVHESNIRLPPLNLGTFDGQPNKWIAFYNLFDNTVHNNTNLTDIEKFTYLLSCLNGEPLNSIKSLPVNSSNYQIAWQQLIKRYNNSRLLITLHVNNILDMPTMQKCSVKMLKSFISEFQENVSALNSLGHKIDSESLFLTAYTLRKFDHDFRSKFEQSRNDSKTVPTIQEFIDFVEKECVQREAADFTMNTIKPDNMFSTQKSFNRSTALNNVGLPSNRVNTKSVFLTSSNRAVNICAYCSASNHLVYRCDKFLRLTPQERLNFVFEKHLCTNCLRNHFTKNCESHSVCKVCNKRHHTLLHLSNNSDSVQSMREVPGTTLNENKHKGGYKQEFRTLHFSKNQSFKENDKPKDLLNVHNNAVMVGLSHSNENTVLLCTALVHLQSKGHSTVARAVLDSAAQHTFITESCAQRLCISRFHSQENHVLGISSSAVRTKGMCHLDISSLSGSVLAVSQPVLILDKITGNLPRQRISSEVKERMQNLMLADPTFDVPSRIDILIGADLFAHALLGDSISLGYNMPTALNTIFGYTLIGSSPVLIKEPTQNLSYNLLTVTDLELHNAIQKFWEIENLPNVKRFSPSQEECEKHFKETYSRLEDGKYQVRLPLHDDPTVLGDSSKTALRMFNSLERRLSQNTELKQKYLDFMRDYDTSNHMEVCNSIPTGEPSYFLPHHGVLRDGKLRVVFNASAITSSGVSLNGILHQGPKLHNEIPDIILNFRFPAIVFSCDISQMFRNIWLHEDDRKLQLIYWREDPSQPLQIYKLKTVTYGMSSSPFLANRVIQQLLKDESASHSLAVTALKDMMYVDDALLGCDTLQEALELQKDVIQLMNKGGFSLRKWISNHPSILDTVPKEHRGKPLQFISPEQPLCSLLGMKWFPETDVFSYLVSPPQDKSTKRSVLSAIAHLYDPMGWITPVVFWAKAFMQLLWAKGIQWDEEMPSELSAKWSQFVSDLPQMENILIPRHMNIASCSHVQLHGFCDASESGFCACVYLRIQCPNNEVNIHLLTAKSRVAPLKRISLPRLELCGAHMLSKLLQYCTVQISKRTAINQIFAWCDSTIVLSWIQTPAYRLKTYVANRIAEIQSVSVPILWSHVTTLQNPADCGSRGLLPSQLLVHSLWWKGPQWLYLPQPSWLKTKFDPMPSELIPDIKPATTTVLQVTETEHCDLFKRFSSWVTMIRTLAFIFRFYRKCQTKTLPGTQSNSKFDSSLSSEEILNTTTRIIFLVQQKAFSSDVAALQNNQPTSPSIRRLSPFLDSDGLIRVGGRLKNSNLSFNTKHPILLPKHHEVTNLLIDYFHTKYLHCGPSQLQSLISQQYWILSARSVIRSRIFRCMKCYKCKPKQTTTFMGDLPKSRVTPSRPFMNSAVDYAGPLTIKLSKLRKAQQLKVFICLFICLSTKAVHMEIVMDLTSDAFLAAMQRFTSRRGLVSNLYSDNATNFVGAARQIRETFQKLTLTDSIQHFLTDNCIKFHFIPPSAPHFGGLWERAIQSFKNHLYRVVGVQILTLEEINTLVCRIEAILNSRPITPMSSDPNEYEALTPGHFLTGGPLVSLPELDLTNIPSNRLTRWQLVQAFTQHIWNRWKNEYLHTLQNRSKWDVSKKNLAPGDLVILHDDSPPLKWRMGRVVNTFPGKDNIVRVVEVRTPHGIIKRPAVKLSLLPMN